MIFSSFGISVLVLIDFCELSLTLRENVHSLIFLFSLFTCRSKCLDNLRLCSNVLFPKELYASKDHMQIEA